MESNPTSNKLPSIWKALVLAFLVIGIGSVMYAKRNSGDRERAVHTPSAAAASRDEPATGHQQVQDGGLPRLVDLGADKCIPCVMMKPILDELKRDYRGQFTTEFIDVWKNPKAGHQYGVQVIPTQIFYDADGNELFRHQGYYSKEDILGKWKELGIEVEETSATRQPADT